MSGPGEWGWKLGLPSSQPPPVRRGFAARTAPEHPCPAHGKRTQASGAADPPSAKHTAPDARGSLRAAAAPTSAQSQGPGSDPQERQSRARGAPDSSPNRLHVQRSGETCKPRSAPQIVQGVWAVAGKQWTAPRRVSAVRMPHLPRRLVSFY